MPDICKCKDVTCPNRDQCYRYTSTDSEFWQSYFTDSPRDKESGECKYFWPILPEAA